MNQLQLDEIVGRIDGAFGEELPFSDRALTDQDGFAPVASVK